MALERKRESEIIPQYSMTGDLLSFLRCGLQYRYHSGSALPPSRPVQLWFGEFIHGVMESAYRLWQAGAPALPWPCSPTVWRQPAPAGRAAHDVGTLGEVVESALRAQGKVPRSTTARKSAYRRVNRAVNELGPHLFPLIASAEQRVIGTRQVPLPRESTRRHVRARRYELHGVIDVLTDVQLTGAPSTNVICQAIQDVCPSLAGRFEVIVDYKGSRRPPTSHPYWKQGLWQLQTYAWLRTRQPQSLPVAAGVLLYVNELLPVQEDLVELKKEVRRQETDVLPERGSLDERYLSAWQPGNAIPAFSLAYRLRRALRVVPVNEASQQEATAWFDQVVLEIERCVAAEAEASSILGHWEPRGDEATCSACDFRYFCPNPAPRQPGHTPAPTAPSAP